MNKKIIVVVVLIAVVAGGYFFFLRKPDASSFVSGVTVSSSTPSYTLSDISKHSTSSDCWTAVSGQVYDVTAFIPSHPDGQAILKACGKDGTKLFMGEDEHAEQNAQTTLDTYFIGTLKN